MIGPRQYSWNYQQLLRNIKRHDKREGLGYRTKRACVNAASKSRLYETLVKELGSTMQSNPAMTVEAAMKATGHTPGSILRAGWPTIAEEVLRRIDALYVLSQSKPRQGMSAA